MKIKGISFSSRIRQLIINMAAQTISFVVSFGISFFLTPYIVENIGVEANGFVGLANNFTGYVSIITTALTSMAGRFITISIHRKDYKSANKYMSSVFMANIVLSAVIAVPMVYVLANINTLFDVPSGMVTDVTILWSFMFFSFLLGNVMSVFNVAAFSQNRLDIQSGTGIVSNILRAAFLVVAYSVFDARVWYLGCASLITSLISISVNLHCKKKMLPQIHIKRKYFEIKAIKELVASGVWNSISQVSGILSEGLDLLVANIFVGATAMGQISLAKSISTHILSLLGSISSVFAPQLTISYAKNDFEDIKKQLSSAIKLLGFVSCIPIAILYAYGEDFFELWVPGEDAKLLQTLTIVAALEFPLVLPLEPLWNIFTITNKVKQSSIYLVINSMLTIGIVFALLQFAQTEYQKMLIIVGVSTAFSIIRALTFLPLFGAKCLGFKLNTFYKPELRNVLAVAILTLISFVIKSMVKVDSWLMLIVVSCATMAMSVFINYFLVLGKNERIILKNKLFSLFNKKTTSNYKDGV